MSNRGSRSAHRSAISANSASLIDVQSLVSTWMDICRSVLLGLPAVCTAGPGLPWTPDPPALAGWTDVGLHARSRNDDFTGFGAACRIRPPSTVEAERFSTVNRHVRGGSDRGHAGSPAAFAGGARGRSGADGVGPEQHPQLTDKTPATVDIELGGQPEHLLTHVEEDRGVAGML